jgi:predicted DsbA family dithiol-disulfide isomerase
MSVQIDLWSDFACPWCALGIYRLDAARAQFEHGDEVTVRHRSFELDPRAPARRPESMEELLRTRYGMSPAQVRAGHERLTALGAEVGMEFNFDSIQLGNTFDAHRLAQAARASDEEGAAGVAGTEDAVVKRLFAAYFTEGALLSDHETLRIAGKAARLDGALVDGVLESDRYADDVRADESAAQDGGITGVPHFVINGAWAVPGAQDVETMVTVLRRAWERSQA